MKRIFYISIFLLIFASSLSFAGKIESLDPNSPIIWSSFEYRSDRIKKFSESEFRTLYSYGYSNEKLKLKCDFQMNKGFTPVINTNSSKFKKIGGEYMEQIEILCKINGVSIDIKPITCFKSNDSTSYKATDTGKIVFNNNDSGIELNCRNK